VTVDEPPERRSVLEQEEEAEDREDDEEDERRHALNGSSEPLTKVEMVLEVPSETF
jgi:hypothetical protein